MNILTIDLGTSGPKVAFYNYKLQCLGFSFKEVALLLTNDGGAEQDPKSWTDAIFSCYEKVILENNIDPKSIEAINISSQWAGTVAIDENGIPLINALIWMDKRGATNSKKILKGFINFDGYSIKKALKWIDLTGGLPSKSGRDPIAHILYLKNEKKEIYQKTKVFLEPKDYLNFYFTGIINASVDSIACHWVTNNKDINNIFYDDKLIKLVGLDKNKLPPLIKTNSVVGVISDEISKKFNLKKSVVVISGCGDVHAAAVGSGAIKDFEAHLYVGTSSWLVSHVPFKKTNPLNHITTIPSGIPGRYMIINEQQTAGACLNFLRDKIFFPDGKAPENFYELLDLEASKISPLSDDLIFLPWLNGERTPTDDIFTHASFYNLSLKHSRSHMARAVLEGVAFNTKWLLEVTEKLAGKKFNSIRFIGGGANSKLWCQIFSDVLNRKILQVSEPLHSNNRGVAMLALMALNQLKKEEIDILVKQEFIPDNKLTKKYDDRFKIFKEIYKINKPLYKKLNKG